MVELLEEVGADANNIYILGDILSDTVFFWANDRVEFFAGLSKKEPINFIECILNDCNELHHVNSYVSNKQVNVVWIVLSAEH